MKASTFDFGKKALLVLAVICFVLGLATQGCSRSASTSSSYSMTDEFGDIKWPSSGIATLLPEPESKYGKIMNDSATSFNAYIGNTSKRQFDDYIDKCMENGFTVDYSKSSIAFNASDAEKNDLSLFYDEDESYMSISLSQQPSSSSAATTSTSSSSAASEQSVADNPTAADDTPLNGIRPSFKEAMDSYEKFFDEYCAFMQKYNAAGNPVSMAVDYAKFMAQYTETMNKLDAIGEEDLSDQEFAYYTEVMGRINQKLAETATAM